MVSAIYSNKAAQHHNPVPNAAILGGLLVTSGILGKRLESDDYPVDKGEQTALVFSYLEVILDEAGATPQDVIKLDLYFADKADRALANEHWLLCGPIRRTGLHGKRIRPHFPMAAAFRLWLWPFCRRADRRAYTTIFKSGRRRWCCQRDSNTRPHPYQGCALPLELWQHYSRFPASAIHIQTFRTLPQNVRRY